MEWPTFRSKSERRKFEAELLARHIGLAYAYAKNYNIDIPFEDRLQEALVGIVEGIRKFDPSRPRANFRACIIGWIRQRLRRMNHQKPGSYSMPVKVWNLIFNGDEKALEYQFRSIPIDRDVTHQEPPAPADPEGQAIRRFELAQWRRLVDRTLNPREARVIYLFYGLDDRPPANLAEIAASFGVSRERIRQVRNQALEKLRAMMHREELLLETV
jgi:RNA polymerase primary sigma factor